MGESGKGDGFNVRASLRAKYRCQLIVRPKANKCYQELLCYLSSYINLLNIRLCSGQCSSRKCYWRCNRYHPRGCPDCIAGHIALIVLTVSLIVFVFGSILCFRYRFHYLLLKVQAVQDTIHFTHKSRTHIRSSIKTRLQNSLGCLESRLDLLPCHRLKLMLTS